MNDITRATADDRVFYLDFCRASFLLLGIVLHAALPFVPGGGWLIAAPVQSEPIYYIYKAINSFRMHGFFLIAGLLAVVTIRNRPSVWFRTRVARLGIPLVCAGLVLLPFESIARTLHGDAVPASIGSLVVSGLREHATLGFHLVSHLWFLVDLLVFSALLALASGIFMGRLADRSLAFVEASVRVFLKRPLLFGSLLIGLLFVYIEVVIALGYRAGWRVAFVGDDFHYSIISGFRISYYAPFFAFGAALALSKDLLRWYVRPSVLSNLVAVSVLAVFVLGPSSNAADSGLSAATGILVPRLFVGAAFRWLNRRNAVIEYVVARSYSVYIFHQPIILWISYPVFLTIGNAHAGFLVIILGTTALAFAAAAMVRRSNLAALAFNGVPPSR